MSSLKSLLGAGGGYTILSSQSVTTSQNVAIPTGAVVARVVCVGGGGGGGTGSETSSTGHGGYGGGGAEIVERYLPLSGVTSPVSVTVGAGGAGRPSGPDVRLQGSDGGASSFGSFVSARGGPSAQTFYTPQSIYMDRAIYTNDAITGYGGGATEAQTSSDPAGSGKKGIIRSIAGGGGQGASSSNSTAGAGGESITAASELTSTAPDGTSTGAGADGNAAIGLGGAGGAGGANNVTGYDGGFPGGGGGGGGSNTATNTCYGGGDGGDGVVFIEWWGAA